MGNAAGTSIFQVGQISAAVGSVNTAAGTIPAGQAVVQDGMAPQAYFFSGAGWFLFRPLSARAAGTIDALPPATSHYERTYPTHTHHYLTALMRPSPFCPHRNDTAVIHNKTELPRLCNYD